MRPEDYAEIERHIRAPVESIRTALDHAQRQDATARALQLALQRSRPKHFTQGEQPMKGQNP